MSKSLQDQLLEHGLVDRRKLQQAKQAKHKQARRQGAGQRRAEGAGGQAGGERAQAAAAEKRARDRELNRQRDERAARRALAAEIEQLVAEHRADRVPGDAIYQFVDDGKIKRVYVSEALHAGLARGTHGVVRLRRGYAVVERGVAERVAARDARAVVALHDPHAVDAGADEEYAGFEVPDDLQW